MYQQANPSQALTVYAGHVLESLLRDLAFGIQRGLGETSAANVHDLRRVCLRLRHALRLFGGVLPGRPARKVRRRLGEVQDLLAAVRSCDVALETLDHHSVVAAVASRERKQAAASLAAARRRELRPLRARLRRMQRADTIRRWRTRLLGTAETSAENETSSETAR